MDRPFLLTYKGKDGKSDFAWFCTQEEGEDYMKEYNISESDVFEFLEIINCKQLR